LEGGFFKSNWVYLLWFVVYFAISWFLFGVSVNSFVVILIIYAVSIGIALSPMGEELLRLIQGAKLVQTQREKEYLIPLFEEVYENAMQERPSLSKKIKLYVDNSMTVNAYAIGKETIVLTRGAIEGFTEDELRGVLAHELGHIANGDTKALLLNVIGNGVFTLIILCLRFILFGLQILFAIATGNAIVNLFMELVKWVIDLVIFVFMFIGQLILAINSRQGEYIADDFAYGIGFGENLIEALYMLKKMSMGGGKGSLLERMRASHPDLENRIARLEGKAA